MSAVDKREIIKIKNVNKSYGDVQVLKNIDLEVYNGEVLVLLGPSGSGKSTLLKIINGLENIQTGEVLINEEVYNCKNGVAVSGKKRAEVGMVFQQYNLYPHMTVLDNVTLAVRKVKKKTKEDAMAIAIPILRKVGLEEKIHFYPSQLSGGEQQRVAIVRSLAMQPKVMLFDEPTSALDVELINEVLDTLIQLSKDGMTMVVVTHELSFARRVATRVAFLDKGELIEIGKPHDIIMHPKMERTKLFMNKIHNERSRLYDIKKRGSINIGIVDNAPPMCFHEKGGELIGFDVDLAHSIARRLNVTLNLILLKNENRMDYILANKVDACIAKLNHTKSRDKMIDFSVSYLQDCKKILMYKDNIKSIRDLAGKDIAYSIGTSTANEIESCFKKCNLEKPNFIAYSSDAQAFEAMKNKLVEGYASDEIIGNYFITTEIDKEEFQYHPEVCCYSYFSIGVSENDSQWLNELNNILLDIYDTGDYEKIFNTWFKTKDKKFLRPFEKWDV
ncbi:ATP-binding cassette domain-containing protein [Anaeromicropila populeti]|uniref:ABC-type polar amino acid transport system, ATPase component n=2 Tax=Anaeromicropila populeti TaxID=37658 RepID=A0A1I6HT25_9FIRM|nr:transporter substrate-binding domain-containing protein [Anaeromicropila populeti]SFR57583.1 ABC-type polar amino acid transport system, ATPase component [Anaeromicropila populeti]